MIDLYNSHFIVGDPKFDDKDRVYYKIVDDSQHIVPSAHYGIYESLYDLNITTEIGNFPVYFESFADAMQFKLEFFYSANYKIEKTDFVSDGQVIRLAYHSNVIRDIED